MKKYRIIYGMEKKFKISVIIPIYNVEKYLEEAIESVINQSIGFKENIELILVNDGSPDDSEKICLRYSEKYPDNVVYLKQENQGVSAARNNGLSVARGEYINFLDADDKWSINAFEKGIKMLDKHPEIDLVGFRLKFFEARDDFHMLDYKYTGDRIVDVLESPQDIILHSSCTVVRKTALANKAYDKNIKISEDTKLLYEIILEKHKYGLISSENYNYRKRFDETSAIQKSKTKKYWYKDTLDHVHNYLVQLSLDKYGEVIEYVQHFIIYDLHWRLINGITIEMTDNEREEYVDALCKLLSSINDKVILFQRNMADNYKLLALLFKYKESLPDVLSLEKGVLLNNVKYDNVDFLVNRITEFEINNGKLLVIGEVNFYCDFKLYYRYNGKEKEIKTFSRNSTDDATFELIKKGYTEHIDIDGSGCLEFYIEINGKKHLLKNNNVRYSKLNNVRNNYYYENDTLFTMAKERLGINIENDPGFLKVVKKETRYLLSLARRKELSAAAIRGMYWLTKPFIKKKILLFCDREFMAGDSAEVLFKYFNKVNSDKSNKSYFVVDKRYDDYQRMKEYGKAVSYHTLKYMILFLHSTLIISSHADSYITNAFGKERKYFVSLFRFKYIYLTHGILLHDSSDWLNRVNKNFELNVVTSPMEYASIINGPYYFEDWQLIKTGMPRLDNLKNSNVEETNKILFMPSWRSKLIGEKIEGTQRRAYNPYFKESEYYIFYEKLLNDERLLDKLREKDYRIKFCIHPSFRSQLKDFIGNDRVEFAIDVNSQYETLSSKGLVTDYSSAACDFAYLGKPVIYANFDYDHIYDVHYYNKGYFDYDIDGFGPNCKDLESTVHELIKMIDSDFKVEEKYKDRMDKFFFYNDDQNSKRVYDEIIKYI